MSYIHEALKKAQREKDIAAGKYGSIWPTHRYRRTIFKRKWLVPASLILVSVAFSAYSWLNSDLRLFSHHEANVAVSTTPAQTLPFQGGEQSGGDPRANYSQAVALQKEGRLQKAKKLYEAALKRSPNLVSALNNLGAIYIKEKNYAAARKVLEKAVKIEPDYADPYYNLACLHALRKDVGQGLSNLKKAVSVNEAARMWAKTDKDLENLRGHSEYEKIIHKTKSP